MLRVLVLLSSSLVVACGPVCIDERCSIRGRHRGYESSSAPSESAAIRAPGATESVPSAAMVSVSSKVKDAEVLVDGEYECMAPCTFEVEPGEHIVAVRTDDLAPAEQLVTVGVGTTSLELTPHARKEWINIHAED